MEKDYIELTTEGFPNQLKELRLKKGFTQKELAEEAKISQQTISAIEKGKLDPSLKILIAIAGILGVVLLINTFKKKER